MTNIFSGINFTDSLDVASDVFSNVSPIVVIVVGILLAFWVIEIMAGFFKKNRTPVETDDMDDDFDDDFDD